MEIRRLDCAIWRLLPFGNGVIRELKKESIISSMPNLESSRGRGKNPLEVLVDLRLFGGGEGADG